MRHIGTLDGCVLVGVLMSIAMLPKVLKQGVASVFAHTKTFVMNACVCVCV